MAGFTLVRLLVVVAIVGMLAKLLPSHPVWGRTLDTLVAAIWIALALVVSLRVARRVYRPLVTWGACHALDSKLVALFLPICLLGLLGATFSWSWLGMIPLGLLVLYGAVAASAFFLPIPTEPAEDTFGRVHETRKVENRGAPLTHGTPPQTVERASLPARDAAGYEPQAQETLAVLDAEVEVRTSRSSAPTIVSAHEFKIDTESMAGAGISVDRGREVMQVGSTAGTAALHHSSHPVVVKTIWGMDQATKDYWLPLKSGYEGTNERYEVLRSRRDQLREWAERQFTPRPATDGDIGWGEALLLGAFFIVPALLFGGEDSSQKEQGPPLSLAALISQLEDHRYVESGYKTREILARAPNIPNEEILRAIETRIGDLEQQMARLSEEIGQMEATLDNWPCREPPHWEKRRKQVTDRAMSRCEKCGRDSYSHLSRYWRRYTPDFHVHHIRPLSQGGTYALNNLRFLCKWCHGHQPSPGHEKIRAGIEADIRAWYKTFGKCTMSVMDLVSVGCLEDGCKIYGHVGEQLATATVLKQGLIEFQGAQYESLSGAGTAAHEALSSVSKKCNGWQFWRHPDCDGKLVTLAKLRKAYLSRFECDHDGAASHSTAMEG